MTAGIQLNCAGEVLRIVFSGLTTVPVFAPPSGLFGKKHIRLLETTAATVVSCKIHTRAQLFQFSYIKSSCMCHFFALVNGPVFNTTFTQIYPSGG